LLLTGGDLLDLHFLNSLTLVLSLLRLAISSLTGQLLLTSLRLTRVLGLHVYSNCEGGT
jgi:hypothetical protein